LLCQHLTQTSPDSASIATANAVYVVRTILKDLIEQLNAAQLLAFIEVPQQVLSGELGTELQEEFAELVAAGGSLLGRLAHFCLKSLAQLPTKPTYVLSDFVYCSL
jgi:hypothetical protein